MSSLAAVARAKDAERRRSSMNSRKAKQAIRMKKAVGSGSEGRDVLSTRRSSSGKPKTSPSTTKMPELYRGAAHDIVQEELVHDPIREKAIQKAETLKERHHRVSIAQKAATKRLEKRKISAPPPPEVKVKDTAAKAAAAAKRREAQAARKRARERALQRAAMTTDTQQQRAEEEQERIRKATEMKEKQREIARQEKEKREVLAKTRKEKRKQAKETEEEKIRQQEEEQEAELFKKMEWEAFMEEIVLDSMDNAVDSHNRKREGTIEEIWVDVMDHVVEEVHLSNEKYVRDSILVKALENWEHSVHERVQCAVVIQKEARRMMAKAEANHRKEVVEEISMWVRELCEEIVVEAQEEHEASEMVMQQLCRVWEDAFMEQVCVEVIKEDEERKERLQKKKEEEEQLKKTVATVREKEAAHVEQVEVEVKEEEKEEKKGCACAIL